MQSVAFVPPRAEGCGATRGQCTRRRRTSLPPIHYISLMLHLFTILNVQLFQALSLLRLASPRKGHRLTKRLTLKRRCSWCWKLWIAPASSLQGTRVNLRLGCILNIGYKTWMKVVTDYRYTVNQWSWEFLGYINYHLSVCRYENREASVCKQTDQCTSLPHTLPTDAHHAMIRPRHRFESASAAISLYAVRSERGTGWNALVICTPLERITH